MARVEAIHQCLTASVHAGRSCDNLQGQRLRDATGFEIAKRVLARELLGRAFPP